MNKIIKNNSFCQILDINIPPQLFSVLVNLLSYEKPGSGFASRCRTGVYRASFVRLLNCKDYTFPTGLLDMVVEFFKNNNIQHEIEDVRIAPESSIRLKLYKPFPPLRSYQQEAIEAILDNERGIIEQATGCGKSLTMFYAINKLKKRTLILVPSILIIQQMYGQLTDYFGRRSVGQITGGKAQLDRDILIGTPQSVIKYIDYLSDKIHLLIIDEAHHSSSDTIRTINSGLKNAYWRYHSSATPFRNTGDDLELVGVIGSKKLIEYDKIRAMKDGWLVPPIFVIYNFKHGYSGVDTWQQEQKRCLIYGQVYNQKIVDITKDLTAQKRRCIIFVSEIEHGELLESLIDGAVFVNGTKDKKFNKEQLKKFGSGEINLLIATSVLGEGVDIIEADTAIFASVGKSKGVIIQKIGRIMRLAPDKKFGMIIDFTHDNTIFLEKHFKDRLKVYKGYRTKIYYK